MNSATRQAAKEVGHMNKEEQVKYYRDRASSLREMATTIMDPGVRNSLQEIAEKFDRLADYVEGQRHGCTD
jgi:ribosomal protein S15P/S13E